MGTKPECFGQRKPYIVEICRTCSFREDCGVADCVPSASKLNEVAKETLRAISERRMNERDEICVAMMNSAFEPNYTKASTRQVGGTHYKDMGIQTWDVVDTWPREQRIGYYRGGALKYLMRMGSKDENAQEIAKGQHYLEKLLEVLAEISK
jgi:hypothetical protein